MYAGILIFCVISLTRIQSSQALGDNKYSNDGTEVSDFKKEPESDSQITDEENSRSSTFKVQKRSNPSPPHSPDDKNDTTIPENPLFLTSYINRGSIYYAKKSCEVNSDLFLGIKSYSGFLTVNEQYNSNLFFWYFPIQEKPVSESPLIIWLQGGPGTSSLDGLFDSFGPFTVKNKINLIRNPHSWLQDHSLLFIDNPVGSGFSFTDQSQGYARDMPTCALHLKLAVIQLLKLFPELKTVPMFIGGESYGGKYAPALAMELHKAKENGTQVNLQGIFSGNGLVDPMILALLPQTYYETGLLSKMQYESLQSIKGSYEDDLANNRSAQAKHKFNVILEHCVEISDQNAYNFLLQKTHYDERFGLYSSFITQKEVKEALHVKDMQFSSHNKTVDEMLDGDFIVSARPLYNNLLNHGYKVLGYCGLLDLILPCYAESEEYRRWDWKGKQEFIDANRQVINFDNTPLGYFKSGGNLTEIQLRDVGHFAANDFPALVKHVVTDWTHGHTPGLYWEKDEL